jgi:phage terminase large subunit-like protein
MVAATDLALDLVQRDRSAAIRLVRAQRELQRRQRADPLRFYEPHEGQRAFHASNKFERWLFGGNRSGKTFAGMRELLWRMDGDHPHFPGEPQPGWIVCESYPVYRDTIRPMLLGGDPRISRVVPAYRVHSWSETHKEMVLKPHGMKLAVKSYDQGRASFASTSKGVVHLDEPPPKSIFQEIVMRLIDKGGHLFVTLTEVRGSSSWVHEHVFENDDPAFLEQCDYFFMSTEQNRANLPGFQQVVDYLRSTFTGAELEARLYGKLVAATGNRVYDTFDYPAHVGDVALDPRLAVCLCFDFNVAPGSALVAQHHQGEVRAVAEIHREFGYTREICRDLKLALGVPEDKLGDPSEPDHFERRFGRRCERLLIYGDAQGKTRGATTGQSDYAIIRQEFQHWPTAMRVPDANPIVKDRVAAVNARLRDGFGVTHTIIDRTCKHLIRDFEQVVKRETTTSDAFEISKSDPLRSHKSDAWGYFVAREYPVKPRKRLPDTLAGAAVERNLVSTL